MSSLVERIDHLELDLRRVERELEALRREARAGAAAPDVPQPPVARVSAEPTATPPSRVVPRTPAPTAPAPPRQSRRRVDLGELLERFDLLGARGLAIAGGTVTALGITLLFALAAERGWIGPVARVGTGAFVSALVFGAGLVVHRRDGQYVAGLAAVGAGIAGAYATLAAATVLYGLVPDAVALAIAGGIAGVAVVVSLAWAPSSWRRSASSARLSHPRSRPRTPGSKRQASPSASSCSRRRRSSRSAAAGSSCSPPCWSSSARRRHG